MTKLMGPEWRTKYIVAVTRLGERATEAGGRGSKLEAVFVFVFFFLLEVFFLGVWGESSGILVGFFLLR